VELYSEAEIRGNLWGLKIAQQVGMACTSESKVLTVKALGCLKKVALKKMRSKRQMNLIL
jgi:hypothetical protein